MQWTLWYLNLIPFDSIFEAKVIILLILYAFSLGLLLIYRIIFRAIDQKFGSYAAASLKLVGIKHLRPQAHVLF